MGKPVGVRVPGDSIPFPRQHSAPWDFLRENRKTVYVWSVAGFGRRRAGGKARLQERVSPQPRRKGRWRGPPRLTRSSPPLQHHRNTQREFGFAPSSLFSFFRPVWLKCGSGGIPLVMLERFTGCRSRTSSLFVCLTKLPRNRSPSYVHAINQYFGINRLSDWRCAMSISISC